MLIYMYIDVKNGLKNYIIWKDDINVDWPKSINRSIDIDCTLVTNNYTIRLTSKKHYTKLA